MKPVLGSDGAPTVIHGGESLMPRGWSSATDIGLLLQVHEIIKKDDYVDILKDNVNKSLASLTLG